METKDIIAIVKTTLFFHYRFPDKDINFEIQCGYFSEWIERMKSDNPEAYMDKESLIVWKLVLRDIYQKRDFSHSTIVKVK